MLKAFFMTTDKVSTVSQGKIDMATMPLRWGHIRVLIIASLGQVIGQGLATLVGVVIPMVQIVIHPELSAGMQGILGCTALIGRTLGALVFGKLSDRYGYLIFFRLCPILMIVSSLTAYFWHPIPVLLVCLFLMGFSVGGEYSLDPDYISEIMPDRWKLFMVGVAKASASVGSVIVAALCFWMISTWDSAIPWPKLLFIMTGMAGFILLLRLRFAESPGWLMARGERAKAEKAVQYFLGKNVEMPVPPATTAHSTTDATAEKQSGSFFSRNLKKIIFSGVPWACEGLGVYGIGIFLPILIMALGIDYLPANAPRIEHIVNSVEITIWLSIIMLVGFVVGLLLLKKLYHVKMQAWGFFLSAVGLVILLLAYRLHWATWVAIAGFMVFELFLNAGPHLITFILPTQIYPVADRGTGVGVSAAIGKLGAVAGAFFIPVLLKWGGSTLVLIVTIAVMVIGGIITTWLGRQVLPPKPVKADRWRL